VSTCPTPGRPPRIRVLSLQSGAGLGGTELMNFSTVQCMDRTRFDVIVCFLDEAGPVSDYYRREGFDVFHLRYHRRPLPAVAWDLYRLLRSCGPDILHIYGLRANLIGRIIGRLAGCPNIVTSQRNIDLWRRGWHVWLDRLTSRWVALYIANAYAGAERLQKVEHIPAHKLLVIQNGLNATPFERASQGHVRAQRGISDHALVVTCVANFRASKGYGTLLEAVDKLHRQGIPFHLWLVGDGELSRSMEARASSLCLCQHVKFLRTRTDIPDILADSDIFVLASYWEGMPGAIMEAMASKLPVVATRVGGVPELVVDGETGLLVPPRDPAALASALAQLIGDGALRRRMGEAGQRRILAHFRLEDKVRELEEVYVRLARQTPAG
jgi:glycosyltransferase involved in cell wall biosynthesis